jgi:hypothetical protein
MRGMTLVGFVVGAVAIYFTVGTLAVLAGAYLGARFGGQWFQGRKRWMEDGCFGAPPVLIFLLWFLALPVGVLYFVARAWGKMTEVAGDALIKIGETQAAKLRGKTT